MAFSFRFFVRFCSLIAADVSPAEVADAAEDKIAAQRTDCGMAEESADDFLRRPFQQSHACLRERT